MIRDRSLGARHQRHLGHCLNHGSLVLTVLLVVGIAVVPGAAQPQRLSDAELDEIRAPGSPPDSSLVPEEESAGAEPSEGMFWVQVGAFKESHNAARLAHRLRAEGYPAVVRRGKAAAAPHVVWVGKYPTRKLAEEIRTALKRRACRPSW